ncbi:VanZ family protein [Bradyrhizobium sp. CSA207]|uniref:VanZ family protein n=1 Tax=Bradyrhizobium sp. CSA207 TaxID=2698826 RepID=UPI0023AF8A49|nr:VanZ family protein [Bradyrhizobium sp. CSA207]MDE5447243.1 VanZ family protein [Bradyrhizobium sp. CSA207]
MIEEIRPGIERPGYDVRRVALALIAFAALAPIYDRPSIGAPHLEHFAAFLLLRVGFMLTYPNRPGLVILIVIGSALILEALQHLTPVRHGRLIDALIKVAGAICGMAMIAFSGAVSRMARTRTVSRG